MPAYDNFNDIPIFNNLSNFNELKENETMAKVKPSFQNANANAQKIDGSNYTLDESLIQSATAAQNGLMTSTQAAKLSNIADQAVSYEAAANMAAGTVCYVNASGKAAKASYSAEASKATIVALASAAAGSSVNYASPNFGKAAVFSGLTVGGDVFLGATGAVTQSVPTTAGLIQQRLGRAVASNTVDIDIESNIFVN